VRTDWISLLTDYGNYDGFVAACHGVIGRIDPTARVVDITHDVPPGDIRRGAAVLAQTAPFLPTAVHVAVVDPGVGTDRRAVALATPNGVLVGPDNGLLGWAAAVLGGVESAVALTNPAYHRAAVTATFHGRDIFAPVAAHLASGVELTEVGDAIDPVGLVSLAAPIVVAEPGRLACEVLTVDRFGNVQTSADAAALATSGLHPGGLVDLATGDERHRVPFGGTFGSVPRDQILSYVDSAGYLSIAVNGGNAASRLRLRPSDPVEILRVDH
jgi:hypothetical protein